MKTKGLHVDQHGNMTVWTDNGASIGLTPNHSAKVLREITHLIETHPHLYGKDL